MLTPKMSNAHALHRSPMVQFHFIVRKLSKILFLLTNNTNRFKLLQIQWTAVIITLKYVELVRTMQ